MGLDAMCNALPRLVELMGYIPRNWSTTQFILCGSAPLALRGIRDVRDLDVLVTQELYDDAVKLNAEGYWPGGEVAVDVPEDKKYGRVLLRAGSFDFFVELPRVAQCVSFEQIQDQSSLVVVGDRRMRVLSLRHCLAVKALAARASDHRDMMRLAVLIDAEECR